MILIVSPSADRRRLEERERERERERGRGREVGSNTLKKFLPKIKMCFFDGNGKQLVLPSTNRYSNKED